MYKKTIASFSLIGRVHAGMPNKKSCTTAHVTPPQKVTNATFGHSFQVGEGMSAPGPLPNQKRQDTIPDRETIICTTDYKNWVG